MSARDRARHLISATGVWRVLFAVYAVALFIGTHWPNLKIEPTVIERPDLLVHMLVFGTWFGLFWLAAWGTGAGGAARWRWLLIALGVSVVYAGIDEGLQAIPWVRRHAAWDDFGANCLGIFAGAAVACGVILWLRRADRRESGGIRREQA